MTQQYRSDIDGLRAVAVLSVLFFHCGFPAFSGGYIGVDIFFVISGYLITTIIVREIENNNFSIAKFYERRFRRILPALTVVIAVSLMIGFFLLSADGIIDLGFSVIATALFSSNILFYYESGYFDRMGEMKPLLHTWSLAIEEQYYIFFPLLLTLIAKINSKNFFIWLLILGAISLLGCVIFTDTTPSAAFYWLPTRAWEILIGSILALNVFPAPSKQFTREVGSIFGIGMIVFSIFVYTPETSFPGLAALLPTVGVAFVIYCGSGGSSFVYKVLSFRPIVFIGLISYSMYLWHWPIIVYTKILLIKEPSDTVTFMLIASIFFVSALSWKYIETPFRRGSFIQDKRHVFVIFSAVTVTTIVLGMTLILSDGLPGRAAGGEKSIAEYKDKKWQHWKSCQKIDYRVKKGQNLCDIGAKNKPTTFILWGDSHARSLAPGVHLSAFKQGAKGKVATKNACPPLLSIGRGNSTSCNDLNQYIFEYISDSDEIKTVILAARWPFFAKGTRYKQESGDSVQLIDLNSINSSSLSNAELFEKGLINTIDKLQMIGKKIVLVNAIPEVGYDVPSAIMIANITKREVNSIIAPTVKEYRERTKEVVSTFNVITNRKQIMLVSPDAYLCDKSYCKVTSNGFALYMDDDHLSTFGSEYISGIFDDVFDISEVKIIKVSSRKSN